MSQRSRKKPVRSSFAQIAAKVSAPIEAEPASAAPAAGQEDLAPLELALSNDADIAAPATEKEPMAAVEAAPEPVAHIEEQVVEAEVVHEHAAQPEEPQVPVAHVETIAEPLIEATQAIDIPNVIAAAKQTRETARKATKKVVVEAESAFTSAKSGADDLLSTVETSISTLTKGISELNLKALAAMRNNAEASFDHFKALIAVKSLTEAWTLQTEHNRRQFEALNAQTKELSAAATQFASDAAKPIKQKVEQVLYR